MMELKNNCETTEIKNLTLDIIQKYSIKAVPKRRWFGW